MEYAAKVLVAMAFHDFHHFGVGISGMNDDGEVVFLCPSYLSFEHLDLFLLVGGVPVEVKADFSYGNNGACVFLGKRLSRFLCWNG